MSTDNLLQAAAILRRAAQTMETAHSRINSAGNSVTKLVAANSLEDLNSAHLDCASVQKIIESTDIELRGKWEFTPTEKPWAYWDPTKPWDQRVPA